MKNLRELLSYLAGLPQHRRRLYRGQNADKPLLPRFAREAQARGLDNPVQVEQSLLDSFERLSVPHLGAGRPRDNYELLAIAQHYSVPTRLLDWTGNPLFGLWFAVRRDPPSDEAQCVLWILDVQDDHLIPFPERSKDLFELKRTRVFRPAHVTQRIVAQDGWFSAHWYIERKNKFIPLDHQPKFKRHLRKVTVDRKYVPHMRADLTKLGIRNSVLFPELPVLCEELVRDFFDGLGAA